MNTVKIMIVGVGGQGTLLASRILGNCVLGEGYDVKVSEVHGMSQRGGSDVTYLKYGEKVYNEDWLGNFGTFKFPGGDRVMGRARIFFDEVKRLSEENP
jgi:hypothetical protein